MDKPQDQAGQESRLFTSSLLKFLETLLAVSGVALESVLLWHNMFQEAILLMVLLLPYVFWYLLEDRLKNMIMKPQWIKTGRNVQFCLVVEDKNKMALDHDLVTEVIDNPINTGRQFVLRHKSTGKYLKPAILVEEGEDYLGSLDTAIVLSSPLSAQYYLSDLFPDGTDEYDVHIVRMEDFGSC